MLPLEPPAWDRKEYFKARKGGRSEDLPELTRCGPAEVRKRPEYGVIFKSSSLGSEHSQQVGKILDDASAIQFDENCDRNSQVYGSPVDLKLDSSGNVLPERSWDGPCSDRAGISSSRVELPKQNLKLCQSASGDTITCVTPTTPSDGASPWKKPRLRWGEGLAKFEKKSAGFDDGPSKSETISCLSAQISDCPSPATPSSAACISFPGSEITPFTKGVVVDNGKGLSPTLVSESQKHIESFPVCLEKLDLSAITHTVPLLIEMLNSDSQRSEDTISVLSKLLLLKSEILEGIDVTESQVDLLESELKSKYHESGRKECRCPVSDKRVSEMSLRPASPSPVSANTFVVKVPVDMGDLEGSKAGLDSPGTVTSKLLELPPITESHIENGKISDSDCIFRLNDSRFSQEYRKTCLNDSRFSKEYRKTSMFTSSAGKMSDVCVGGVVESKYRSLVSSLSGGHTGVDDGLINSIWTSNREYAKKASSDFNIVFRAAGKFQDNSSDVSSKELSLRELLVRKKKALRFKERAAALKWGALSGIWKNEMRLLSARNYRSKAQKQCEILSRTAQRNRHSARANVKKSSPDVGKLLSISHCKPSQSVLKMPALILDDDEQRMSWFLSKNGLVDDPCASEKERSVMNAWTSEEKDIFIEKLTSHGKDFRKIASFLGQKTVADCVEFYYKNHKSECFARTIKRRDQRLPVKTLTYNKYLVTPTKKWDRDMDTASLEILGAASEFMASNSEMKANKKRSSCGVRVHGMGFFKPPEDRRFPDRPSDFRLAENDIGTAACCSVSSEALSSCITSSVSLGEGHHNGTPKTSTVFGISKPISIPEYVQIDDEETCSDESSCELDAGFWTDREKSVFVRSVKSYGKDFSMVSRCIRTKSKDQCKSFYSKARKCLGLDIVHPDNGHEQQSVINDSNGDGSHPLTSTPEPVSCTGSYKVSHRIIEDMSLSVPVTSNVDLLSPDAGMTFHARPVKLKDKECGSEKPSANLKVEGQFVDKSTVPNDTPIEISESANESVDISPSLSLTLPFLPSSAQVETERGPMEPPGWGHVDNRAIVGSTNPGPPQMVVYNYKGSARHKNSLGSLAHLASQELSNSTRRYTAALPAPDICFGKIPFAETGGQFLRSHCVSNHLSYRAHTLSNQLYASQDFSRGEKTGSGCNLNFKDSTVSKVPYSDLENNFSSYASILPTGYVNKYNSLNASCSIPEKQGNQANLKLFGQVLIPSNAQEPHPKLSEGNKLTQFARPSNHYTLSLGRENLPIRSFWDGHQVQIVPFLLGTSSLSILDRQPLQTTAVSNGKTPLYPASIG